MEFLSALVFYFVFSVFGFIGLPILSRFTSNRYLALSASKLTGLVIFSYIIWLSSSLKILDYQNRGLIFGLFLLFLLVGLFFCWKYPTESFQQKSLSAKNKKNKNPKRKFIKEILIIEGISISIYLLYLLLRSYNPGANNTEHFMDMAFLSASGKTHFFPFIDPWFSGKFVNYYYYGSYVVSLISNLGAIPYSLAYNFALALIFTQSIILSGVLVYAITGLKKCAALASFLVTSAGTLFFAACTIKGAFANPATVCSYASSTRLYTPSYIINEIPSYSFTVGNLHAHLLALPFFLLSLTLLYFLSKEELPKLKYIPLIAPSLAVSGMINAWDFITSASLLGALVLYKISVPPRNFLRAGKWILNLIGTYFFAALLALPAILNFTSPVLGLGFIPSYIKLHNLSNVQYPTPALALLGMWGIFTAGIILWIFNKKKNKENLSYLFALALISFGILLGVELFFIKDIYSIANPPYFRANTTFKFGYHAWTMLSILFSVAMASFFQYFFSWQKFLSGAAKTLFVFSMFAGIFYPYQAIVQFYNGSDPLDLDNSAWMKKIMPDDLKAIDFINRNLKDRAVIAEAVGDSYTNFARITTFSGMITPMGWRTHEWTWRFNGKDAEKAPIGQQVETGWGIVSLTSEDISKLYQTPDEVESKKIIEKYGIKYIYIGDLERQTYPMLNEEKISKLGKLVFESGTSKLYSIN